MIIYPVYVLWQVTILFGCHGNIKLKKMFSDKSPKPMKQCDSVLDMNWLKVPFEQTLNPISTVGSMWNLVETGLVVSEELFNNSMTLI